MASRINDVDEFLSQCRQEFHDDKMLDQQDREEAEADNVFANASDESLGQWNPAAKAFRLDENVNLPVLQLNRIPTYIQHVTNAGRMNRPSIKITPGDNGTPEGAEMREGRIRQVEYESDASTVYDTARDQQISSGRGFIRALLEVKQGNSGGSMEAAVESAFAAKIQQALENQPMLGAVAGFIINLIQGLVRKVTPRRKARQVPRLDRIENQFCVIWGPHLKYDASDAERCWVVRLLTEAQYKRQFGEEAFKNHMDFADFQYREDWIWAGEERMYQVAEKWQRYYDAAGQCTAVCQYIIDGNQVLEEEDFIIPEIPIVPQWGREAVVNGVQRHYSLINNGKAAQRLINLYISNIAFEISKIPKARWLVEMGSVAAKWEDDYGANSPKSLLKWLSFDVDTGRPLNKPEILTHEPAIEGLTVGLRLAIEDLKASMGIYDASMGQRSNETTGIAIQRRKVEGEVTNYHFVGNEERTRKRVGTLLLMMISELDRGATSITVRHANGKTEQVPMGRPYKHPRTGKTVTHYFTDDDDYQVETEQTYASAREKKEEAEQALIQAAPELLFTELGVNMIRNSGRPGADEDADALARFVNMKFPGLIPDKEAPQIPQAVQAQIQGLQQKLQTTDAFAQSLHQQIQTKQVENEAKLQIERENNAAKIEIVRLQEATKKEIALATLQAEAATLKLEQELGITRNKVDRAHELAMQQHAQQHDASQQQSQQQAAADQQESAQSAAAEQAESATEAGE